MIRTIIFVTCRTENWIILNLFSTVKTTICHIHIHSNYNIYIVLNKYVLPLNNLCIETIYVINC